VGRRRAQAALLLAALTIATMSAIVGPAAAEGAAPAGASWSSFTGDRTKLLERLAPAFVSCFQRRDSAVDPLSPIFHGCLDWHSAVHAAYSHHVLYRRTGDEKYLELAQNQIAPQGVSLVPVEHLYEQAKGQDLPLTENPYGFGWFLVLARERERAADMKDFREMADYAADMLIQWFDTRLERGDTTQYILDTAHPNYSWSLVNLDLWAKFTKAKKVQQAVRRAVKPLLDPGLDRLCTLKNDRNPKASGFQPACLMRLATVAHIFGDDMKRWVAARVPRDFHVPPVTEPVNCHAGGLNFTRAFALYQLYEVTGNESFRDNHAALIRYHVSRPDLYMGESYAEDPGYLCYSHWVAQMGVRAISLSYGD